MNLFELSMGIVQNPSMWNAEGVREVALAVKWP